MSMERWRKPLPNRPRPSRPMPHWMIAATAAGVRVGGDSPPVMPPPPPPPVEDPDYEVIEVAPAAYMNGPPRPPPMGSVRKGTGRHCDLCGGSTPAVRCDLCSGQIFCSSCDDMYHRHPKRQSHVRRILETATRPPLPPRGEIGMAPVPPPRSRQKRTTTLFRLPSTGGFLSVLGKERQQDSLSSRKEFSLSEKMGSLRRMMGSRPLPPTPTQSHMSSPRNPMMTHSNQQIEIETSQPSKFHTMRDGVGHSSFRHNSDFMSRWRHPSLSNPPEAPSKPSAVNGHRRTSMGDLWEQRSAREPTLHHPSNLEHGGQNWQSNASDGRVSPSPWGQQGFIDNGTATLNRRRRSEMSPTWNSWQQRGGMAQSASVTDLNAGLGPWGGPGGVMQQTQSMAHLHCPACMVNPSGHPWSMPMQEHWHCGAGVLHNPAAHGWGGSMMHLWPHHPPPPVVISPNVHHPEIQRHPDEGDWNAWEDGTEGKMSDTPEQNDKREKDETEDKAPLFVPNVPWSCEHCTFVNKAGTRVCAVCCKTPSTEVEPVRNLNRNLPKEPKDWSDARSHISQKSEGDRLSVKGRPKEIPQEIKKAPHKMIEVHDDQSSQEGSVITAVQDIESNRWKSYSPRPRKKVTGEKQNHFRIINDRPPSVGPKPSAATETIVQKVSMGVGTSPPREMKLENKNSIKGSMTSVGTSPPPQSISTQTYETPPSMKSSSLEKKTSEFGSQYSFGQDMSLGGQGSVGSTRRMPRLRRTLSLTLASKQRETTPNAFLRSQSRHSLCGNSGDQSTPEPPVVPVRRRLPSSTSTSSEYYNPSGEADGEWSGGDDDRKEKDKVHGLELVRLLREAEQSQFTAEELEVALKHCGNKANGTVVDGGKGPLAWLKANWLQMVDTVATLATNFGLERRENTVGTVSNSEAREALRKEGGDVWAAVTRCVESRQRKYAELVSRGNFTREDIVSALSNSQGSVEIAFNELSKSQLKPFLMRIWGPPVSGAGDNESGNSAMQVHSRTSSTEEINNIIEASKGMSSDLKEDGKVGNNDKKMPVKERQEVVTEEMNEKKPSFDDAELGEKTLSVVKDDLINVAKETVPYVTAENSEIDNEKDKESAILEGKKVEVSEGKSMQTDGCERLARQLLAEGHVNSYERAEIAAILMLKENTSQAEALLAVQECNSVDAALSYLRQECLLCTGHYPMNQMVSMLTCIHRCCQDCARLYFMVQIRDRSIEDAVCPFCKEPNFPKKPVKQGVCDIEEVALNYYSNLDILLKGILDPGDHELFLRKLRDRTLANDPNFRWCTKCSSGFFADPRQKRLACPDCKSVTCASCSRPWAKQHEGLSCDLFARWLEENDPATQAAGLARHLSEASEAMLSCPHCNSRFALAKGGCMHLTCPQCRHEFCSGCGQTFAMGTQCTEEVGVRTNRLNKEGEEEEEEEEEGLPVAVTLARGHGGHPCARLGLHAHHPRDCLFYLRDMETGRLQKLLKDNGVEYNTKNPQAVTDDGIQKRSDDHMKCQVQVQREGPAGLIDGFCEEDVPEDHAGLCRLHYIEYLVGVMRRAGLDPAPLFDQQEAVAELRRRHVTPPDRPKGTTDEEYRQMCIEMIQRLIPLKTAVPAKQDK